MDINHTRDMTIRLHGLLSADNIYTLYYDETNNIRRLHVVSDGLNWDDPQCFVAGGVAHGGKARTLDLTDLRSAMRIQKSSQEIKLKHIAKGAFLDLLTSAKIEIALRWIGDQGLLIHYTVIDPMYWSVVDIIDSILAEVDAPAMLMYERLLKSDLYTILRHDQNTTLDLFRRHSYPDVGPENRAVFIGQLLELLEFKSDLLPHVNYMMLKGVIQMARNLENLPFLQGESPNILIDSFGPFFAQRIFMLKNATHILDAEDVIKDYLLSADLRDGDAELTNYRFAVSHEEPGIQLSDIVVGILGKMFSFIRDIDTATLHSAVASLTTQQARNLVLIQELIASSIKENAILVHYILSSEDLEKMSFLLDQQG